jgi:hypothetical protein
MPAWSPPPRPPFEPGGPSYERSGEPPRWLPPPAAEPPDWEAEERERQLQLGEMRLRRLSRECQMLGSGDVD